MHPPENSTQQFPVMKIRIAALGFGALLLSLLTGCSVFWNKPVSDSFASVTITNTTYADVQAVTIQVFRASDYKLTTIDTNSDMMTFDKEGTHGQNIAYNSVFDMDDGKVIVDRVKTVLRNDLDDGTFLLECQAYIVQDSEHSALSANEIQLRSSRSRPYQDILDRIKNQINPPPPKK